MAAKYFAVYGADQGQYAGKHYFFTMKERARFMAKATELGYTAEKVGKDVPKPRVAWRGVSRA